MGTRLTSASGRARCGDAAADGGDDGGASPTAAKCCGPDWWTDLEPSEPGSGDQPSVFQARLVRDDLGVKTRNLRDMQLAMLADVEDADGTGS